MLINAAAIVGPCRARPVVRLGGRRLALESACANPPQGEILAIPPRNGSSQRSLRRTKWLLASLLSMLAMSAAASAKGTGYVFVSHEKTNNIAVIDPKQDYRIIKWIDTSHRPRDMNFRHDRAQLLVACGDDDVIDVIDVATLQVVDHIPTGPSPEMFELSHDEASLYVSDEEASAVQEISIKDKIIERDIATGAEPEGIAITPDGKTLYVTSEVSDMVHVVDLAAGAVTDNVVVGTRPRRFLLLPNGKELWVSNELSGQVSIIDRATNQVSMTMNFLPPGFRQVDVTPVGMTMTKDGATAIITLGRANYVAFVDTATRKIKDYVLVGNRPWGVALSPDEKTLYVANGLSDDISIVDMASHKSIRAVPVGRVPHTVLVDD
jgi:PQQ-dependent catabolism-associated beta-propeller protein